MKKRGMFCLVALLLFVFGCAGAEITIEEVATQIGENRVAYPQLKGMEDEAVQQKINDDIVMASKATNHMMSLLALTGQQTLDVSYDAYLDDEIFSVIISAKGKLPPKRDGHEYTALTYELATGEKATLDRFFSDVESAVAAMEQKAVESLSEELNGYMEFADIAPLPADSFTVDEHGITFWYPAEQFSLVSGYSGACQFWYEELEEYWNGIPQQTMTSQEQKTAIHESVASGILPHIPAQMGQGMQEIADEYRLLREPDEFPGGRYFIMEDPAFRNILLISDALTDDYANSEVEGIQLRRGSLHGLLIGKTVQDEWRLTLGTPEETILMTESMAYDYGLRTGSYDIYHFGDNELRLYADTQGLLYAIQLCK